MEGKFKKWQKVLLTVTFVAILFSAIYKGFNHTEDIGSVIMLSFVTLLFFGVLYVAALFPATWRMREKYKKKIKDPVKFQEIYTCSFVILNVVICTFFIIMMWKIL